MSKLGVYPTEVSNKKAKNTYAKMMQRCYDESNKDYHSYGGRGIIVCDHWKVSVLNFYNDLKDLPNAFIDKYTMDRIDNNGNYTLDNIRFVTMKEQSNNRRSNHIVSWEGVEYPLTVLAEKFNLTYQIVKDRLDLGFDLETALLHKKCCKRVKTNVNIIKRGRGKFTSVFKFKDVNFIHDFRYDDNNFEGVFLLAVEKLNDLCCEYNLKIEEFMDIDKTKEKFTHQQKMLYV